MTTRIVSIDCHDGDYQLTKLGLAQLIHQMRWADIEALARELDNLRREDRVESKKRLSGMTIADWAQLVISSGHARRAALVAKKKKQQAAQPA